jgi:hypothetical protein
MGLIKDYAVEEIMEQLKAKDEEHRIVIAELVAKLEA